MHAPARRRADRVRGRPARGRTRPRRLWRARAAACPSASADAELAGSPGRARARPEWAPGSRPSAQDSRCGVRWRSGSSRGRVRGRSPACCSRSLALIPLAAFELVVTASPAGHPGLGARRRGRGAGLRGDATRRPPVLEADNACRPVAAAPAATSACGTCEPGTQARDSCALDDVDLDVPCRQPGRGRRSERVRQVDAGRGARCASSRTQGSVALGGVELGSDRRGRRPPGRRARRAGPAHLRRHGRRQPSVGPTRRDRRRPVRRAGRGRPARLGRTRSRRSRTPRSASTARRCRAASVSGWRWRGRCSPTSRCWCSTSRPSTSTSTADARSPPTCSHATRGRSIVLDHPPAGWVSTTSTRSSCSTRTGRRTRDARRSSSQAGGRYAAYAVERSVSSAAAEADVRFRSG